MPDVEDGRKLTSISKRHAELITRLTDHVLEKLPKSEALIVEEFVRHYYLSVAPQDLLTKSVLDLYGALVSHWHFIQDRKPGETKVRVFNPQLEEHGWQSTHTIIEIAQDDMPFLVDSIRMELTRMDINIYMMIHMGGIRFVRDKSGNVIKVIQASQQGKGTKDNQDIEAPVYIEVDRQSDPKVQKKIQQNILRILDDVKQAVNDWGAMRKQATQFFKLIDKTSAKIEPENLEESKAFLKWIVEDNFTFLGYCEYDYDPQKAALTPKKETALGLAKNVCQEEPLSQMSNSAKEQYLSSCVLLTGKSASLSTVHRPVYRDFISIKVFDKNNHFIKEHRFEGLYTAVAYNSSPKSIPFLRRKMKNIIDGSGFPVGSHDSKALSNILETLPRDDFLHSTDEDLHRIALGILHLQERQRIRVFIRRDTYGRYFSCLAYVPRDKFNSELREKMQDILLESLHGTSVTFTPRFSASILARIHFMIRVDPVEEIVVDEYYIENKLIEAARSWEDDLQDALTEHSGEEKSNELMKCYGHAFPSAYKESFSARTAVIDIQHIETLNLCNENAIAMSLYRPIEESEDSFRFKLFRCQKPIPLTDVVPMLENMGLRIMSERPYCIKRNNNGEVWINDYRMLHPRGERLMPEQVKDIFQEAFAAIWQGHAENDGFNQLVLSARLSWREISMLRAIYKYLWQTGLGFSQSYVEEALYSNSELVRKLVQLMIARFHPKKNKSLEAQKQIKQKIIQSLEKVKSLNEDRIIRLYVDTIFAMLRTNYFQSDQNKSPKNYISMKFDSAKVPDLPLPRPMCEIFVYAPWVEGIHIRTAKVARGGLRWSDRHEDFRTEILGLVKAQKVKNAVIVPMGAKGGFVVKTPQEEASREEIMNEGIRCYKTFISGLLDITDNRVGEGVEAPKEVVRYDEDDPYLVVAADKGTATFSDIANEVAISYNFWLGDAFASGGSAGYDHKKMGITARGAWESVKMHFLRFGHDVQQEPLTVVGIGDMSGDVFGNGMLLSKHIKLVAAFNHLHIFIDPDPDPAKTWNERKRLFDLPRSAWTDYNEELISKGGGIFWRSAKSVEISPEMKALFDIKEDHLMPNDLIKAILKAKVDLLWNGGIGTYAKSSKETNHEVGDRANDAVRVNATELRCKVVGEGGNLGFTQLARVEYALKGGIINTDAIDNSAGVNCSDNEVNIKVLLNNVIEAGDLTIKQRNQLLVEMEDEVAEIVLTNNRRQNEAITMAEWQAAENLQMHDRLLKELERIAGLDREIESLPDKEEIARRKAANQGLTRPEIAVVLAYSKIKLKEEILASSLPEDAFVLKELGLAFPMPLRQKYHDVMCNHRLKREIIATQLSNLLIDEMGITFVHRLRDEAGAVAPEIVRAYLVAREVFEVPAIRCRIANFGTSVDFEVQLNMLRELNRMIRRNTRWFLRNRRAGFDIADTIALFSPGIRKVKDVVHTFLMGTAKETMEKQCRELNKAGVPEKFSETIALMTAMLSALDIVEASITENIAVLDVVEVYYAMGSYLRLGWFREQIKGQHITNHWEALARASFRDDVDRQQRSIAVAILKAEQQGILKDRMESWITKHADLLERWHYFIGELEKSKPQFTMFAVALRELLDLSQIIIHQPLQKQIIDL